MANYGDSKLRTFPVVSPKAGGAEGTLPARTFPPNGYGLYDMTGNAWPWVADWYGANYFSKQAKTKEPIRDPRGPAKELDQFAPGVPYDAPKPFIHGGWCHCKSSYCRLLVPSARSA